MGVGWADSEQWESGHTTVRRWGMGEEDGEKKLMGALVLGRLGGTGSVFRTFEFFLMVCNYV